jgi:hypothetical protein
VWVLYVALGALPVFGIGQWTLPLADTEARLWGFTLAVIFVASSLCLLLTSSFLGLRRYLRQRSLQMPASMARSWMSLGAAVLAGVLLLALFLPRPRGLETLAGLGWGLRDRPQSASSKAWMRGEAASGEGRRIGSPGTEAPSQAEASGTEPSGEGRSGSGSGPGSGNPPGGPAADEGSGDPASGPGADSGTGAAGGEGSPEGDGSGGGAESGADPGGGRRSGAGTPRPPLDPLSAVPSGGGMGLLRVLSWVLALGVLAYLVLRFGRGWLEAFRRGWPERRRAVSKPGPAGLRERRFPSYADPFSSGRSEAMTPVDLTVYTFQALEAWAADAGWERRPEETPMEFGEALSRQSPESAEEVRGAVRLYAAVAYGGRVPVVEDVQILRRLWGCLR